MSITQTIIEKWIIFYCTLYFYSIPLVFIVLWFWLTYVDRVHLRIKSKEFGNEIQSNIKNFLSKEKTDILFHYCYKQINTVGEIISGFSDGLLNHEPSIDIRYISDIETQTQQNILECIDIEVQTEKKIMVDNEMSTDIINDNVAQIEKNIKLKQNEIINNIVIEETIKPTQIFAINNINKKPILDTELLERDIEADKKVQTKPKRIFMKKK
jgi:hypothetical protein